MEPDQIAESDRGVAVGRWIGRRTPKPLVRPLLALAKCLAPGQYERALRTVEAEQSDGSQDGDDVQH